MTGIRGASSIFPRTFMSFDINLNDTLRGLVIEQLREAADASESVALSDEALVRRASKGRLLGAIGAASGVPAFPQVRSFVDPELLRQADPALLAQGQFVPLRREDDRILVAVANPWDYAADDYCSQRFPDCVPVKILTAPSGISAVIEMMEGSSGPSRAELEAVVVEEYLAGLPDFDVTQRHDEPIAQLVAGMLANAIRQHASDVHIKTEKHSFFYVFRVDGDLGPRTEMPMKLRDRVDAFMLNLMKLAPEERTRRPGISGRFTANYYGRSVGIRYERHRTYRGYHVTIRLLDKTHLEARLGMGNLAFDESTLFELEKAMAVPSGIIVMSGPTGSGKSTTLNAMLRHLNRPEDNILTLENPVEDEIPGVTHCDLKDSSEFKPMIASFMRSDPDIIFMGEVRDRESAELAIEAAITGHKVLTTIHTPRASQIIERFQQLGMERWKIAQTLKAACAQRLVKLLCPACRVPRDGLAEHDRRLFLLGDEWKTTPVFEHHKEGCTQCGGRGYAGRTALLEILPITPRMGDLLAKGEMSPYEIELVIRKETGLPSLRDNGLKLLASGKTDLEALRRVLDLTYHE